MAASPHNRLAGNLLKQGRIDGGGPKPLKQEAYARQLANKLGLPSIARQTLSAWERGTTVVPAAALLASAEVLGVDVGQLIENTRDSVRARIADLEALVGTAAAEGPNTTVEKSPLNGGGRSNGVDPSRARASSSPARIARSDT